MPQLSTFGTHLKKFRKFWLGCKWNTTSQGSPLEHFCEEQTGSSARVVLISHKHCSGRKTQFAMNYLCPEVRF